MTEAGCTRYTEATVTIYFPGDEIRCSLCPLLETYARKQCRRTGEYIADGYLRGGWCPLEIGEKIELGEIENGI